MKRIGSRIAASALDRATTQGTGVPHRLTRVRPLEQAVAVAGVVLAFSLVWMLRGPNYDFVYDWLSARAFIDGLDPYQTIDVLTDAYGLTSELQFIHPRIPGALVLLSPIGVLPFSMEYVAGRLLTVASAIGLAWIFARISGLRVAAVLALVPIALLVPPFSWVLAVSQTDFLIAALIGATLLLVRDRDRIAAGIPLGLAVVLKLWAWPLGVALLLGRRWRAAGGLVATFTLLNLLGLSFPHVSIEGTLRALDSAWLAHASRSASTAGLLGILPILLSTLLVVLMISWAIMRRDTSWEVFFIYSIPLSLIVAPILWPRYTVSLLIPVAWFLSRQPTRHPAPNRPDLDHSSDHSSVI